LKRGLDHKLVANAFDPVSPEVINVALAHADDSVQLFLDWRDNPDDAGYAFVLSRESAQELGEALIEDAGKSDSRPAPHLRRPDTGPR